MNIYEKLSAIQAELKAPKSQFNKFGGYNYRNCEDILEAVKPICKKYGTTLILTDEILQIGDRYYVHATAILFDYESKPDDIEMKNIRAHAFAREEESKKGMDGSQVTGASSSYARKYALNGLFNIDDTKDSDATNTGDSAPQGEHKSKPEAPPASQQQRGESNITEEQALTYSLKSGKYAGVAFENVPIEYLEWCDKNFSGKVGEVARIALRARRESEEGLPF